LLAAVALRNLARDLASALDSMDLHSPVPWGRPDLLKQQADAAEKLFQGYAKATLNSDEAVQAARAFLGGRQLDDWQRDAIAPVLAKPLPDLSGAKALGHKSFPALLDTYEAEARRGDLWRLTWHGLLHSYFDFNPVSATDSDKEGWKLLQQFLQRTWPLIDEQNRQQVIPHWIEALRREPDVLTEFPVRKYADAYLRGSTEEAQRLADDVGIPLSSWFWHALVVAAVRKACAGSDAEFLELIPTLIELIEGRPAFRDEALEFILIRHHACRDAAPHERLRDYVCRADVWKNPKLRAAGMATAWNRVPEPVWQMVLSWVNERNLKDFFDILAARNNADEGRLAFWSRYLKQITWTRLVFGAATMTLQRTNAEIRNLIAREEGAYARLTEKPEVDAFMMRIGQYLIVEFSKKPNACYVYQADTLPFDLYSRSYEGGTGDLGAGFRSDTERALRILHLKGWAERAAVDLGRLGIRPDAQPPGGRPAGGSQQVRSRWPVLPEISEVRRAGSDLGRLQSLVSRFRRAYIEDQRHAGLVGRLWVHDPLQRPELETELKAMGFSWSGQRQAWFYSDR
jgi:hypothetical protein